MLCLFFVCVSLLYHPVVFQYSWCSCLTSFCVFDVSVVLAILFISAVSEVDSIPLNQRKGILDLQIKRMHS